MPGVAAEAQESVASDCMAKWMNTKHRQIDRERERGKDGTWDRGHAFSPACLVSRVLGIEVQELQL